MDQGPNYFRIMITKALLFVNAEQLDMSVKRPTFSQEAVSDYRKPVLFHPLSKIKKMLKKIESEATKFETSMESNSCVDLPRFGYKISKYGVFTWYLLNACFLLTV